MNLSASPNDNKQIHDTAKKKSKYGLDTDSYLGSLDIPAKKVKARGRKVSLDSKKAVEPRTEMPNSKFCTTLILASPPHAFKVGRGIFIIVLHLHHQYYCFY